MSLKEHLEFNEFLKEEVVAEPSVAGHAFKIFKNPGTIKRIDQLSRILITPDGDFFICDDGGFYFTHLEMHYLLVKNGEIPKKYKLYDEIAAWVKSDSSLEVKLGEGYKDWDKESDTVKKNIKLATDKYKKLHKNNIKFIFRRM